MPDPTVNIVPTTEQFEGVVPYFYLDTRGNVTIGVGYMVPTVLVAMQLTLVHPDGTAASTGDKAADWRRVKAMTPGMLPRAYLVTGGLRMPANAISSLLQTTEESVWKQLHGVFPDIETYPEPVQLALLDMGYNLGVAKMEKEYCCDTCHFGPAVLRKDWKTCSEQCHRDGIGLSRNQWTQNQFLAAANI